MMTVFEKIKRAMSGTDPYENLQAAKSDILRQFAPRPDDPSQIIFSVEVKKK